MSSLTKKIGGSPIPAPAITQQVANQTIKQGNVAAGTNSNATSKFTAALEGGACFTGDTTVQTNDGYKFIKDITAEDEVYSENPQTGEKGLKKVKTVYIHETNTLINITVGHTEIKATPTHPFWVECKGWVAAGGLNVGDKLRSYSNKTAEVSKLKTELLEKSVKVYNFEVEDWHTYFVSQRSVLVHNSCTPVGEGKVAELRRPYIRKSVRTEVETRAPKTEDGRFIDPNTGLPIEGKYDLGHMPGYEFRREKVKAEAEGLLQKRFNDRLNNPDFYQIEDPISNRSHKYEMP